MAGSEDAEKASCPESDAESTRGMRSESEPERRVKRDPVSSAQDHATGGTYAKSYAEYMIERARELRKSDAFAAPDAKQRQELAGRVHAWRRGERRRLRTTVLLFAAVLLVVVFMSLLLPYYGVNTMGLSGQIYNPSEVVQAWALWFQVTVMPLFDHTLYNRTAMMISEFNQEHTAVYQLVVQRGAVTLVVIACGFLLAVSGMLFQTTFRNPLATPSMLGVSDGVTLGCIVFAFMGYSSAADNLGSYFLCVYGFGALAVVAVMLFSRAIGGGARYNVFDMLLLGTVMCQLLGGTNSYVSNFAMDTTTWQKFYDIQQAGDVLNQSQTWIIIAVVLVCTVVPVMAMRFKLNLVTFSDEEGRMMGVRPGLLRGTALVLGSVMQLAAIASIGQIAMLSLAVPFLVRYLMPSEFRYQLLGNFLMGALVLLACVDVQHFATIGYITVPVGTVIAVLIVPFFVWAVALNSNKWGD